jgi:hypothetical protein
LDDSYLFYATRADSIQRALALVGSDGERWFLARRVAEMTSDDR